jgi:hypothetical protein
MKNILLFTFFVCCTLATQAQTKSPEEIALEKAKTELEEAKKKLATAEANYTRALQDYTNATQQRWIGTNDKDKALAIKAISLAQSIAVKSLDVTDENVEALLAREAHALNQICNGNPYDSYIYKALYEALENLNGKFNSLQDAPEGVKHIGNVRVICVKDSAIYSTGSEGYLLKWKNKTFEKYADHRKTENLPVILGKNPAVYCAMVMTADGKYLIRGGDGLHIEVYNTEQPTEKPKIIQQVGTGIIKTLALMPDQKSIVFATTDGKNTIRRHRSSKSKNDYDYRQKIH